MPRDNKNRKTEKNSIDSVTIILDMVSRVGWSGTGLVFLMVVLLTWPSSEQKQTLIDIYFLQPFTSLGQRPIIIESLVLGLVLGSQRAYYHLKYKKRIELSEKELKRMAKEKTALQQELINRPLTSSSTLEGEEHVN